MTRRSLIFAAIALTTVVCAVPAGATERRVVIQGSVLLPNGHLASIDRVLYTQQGCAQDIRDGRTGAYLDVRGFDFLTLRVGTVGVPVPGRSPKLTVRFYGVDGVSSVVKRALPSATPDLVPPSAGCDLAASVIGVYFGPFYATPTESLSVRIPNNARYVQITLSDNGDPFADVHFTATLIAT